MEIFKKYNIKHRILAANLSIILIFVLIAYFVVLPSINEINRIKSQINGERADLEQKYQKGQNLKKLTSGLRSIESQMDKLDKVFAKKDNELDFITALEKIAEDNNVTQRFTLGKPLPSPYDSYSKTPIQLQANGKYRNIFNYLKGLESSSYYINIKSVDLTSASEPKPNSVSLDNSGEVGISITADTYWR